MSFPIRRRSTFSLLLENGCFPVRSANVVTPRLNLEKERKSRTEKGGELLLLLLFLLVLVLVECVGKAGGRFAVEVADGRPQGEIYLGRKE